MPSADQVPVKTAHSTMRWHKWVVLIAGSTGSAIRGAHAPTPDTTADRLRALVYRASATGFLYRSPLAIMAQAIRAILLASAMAATLVGRRPNMCGLLRVGKRNLYVAGFVFATVSSASGFYSLSLHDALPIWIRSRSKPRIRRCDGTSGLS